ncbi:MAG: YdcF family protein [Trueperaceae bacterium]
MLFELSKIFWWFAQPSKLWLLLVTLGVVLLYTSRQTIGRNLLSVAVALALMAVFLPLHSWLAGPLEQRFPRLTEFPQNVDGILVLGGGVDELLTGAFQQPMLNNAGERMTEAVILAQRYPEAKLVFSGGSSLVETNAAHLSEADVAERLFNGLNLYKLRLIFERESRNTWENAINTKALVKPQENETWLLVTSAQHMPRSIGIVRKVGWNVVPYPTDYRVIPGKRQPNLGFSEKLQIMDGASKEWVGLLAYYLMGRTSAVFPNP